MGQILSIFEEGNSRLFLVGDCGPEGERVFGWTTQSLVVSTDGRELWRIPMGAPERSIIDAGRAHWLECQGERLVRDVLIILTRWPLDFLD